MASPKSREIRDIHPVKAYQLRQGLAMSELAARAEISKAALSLIENYTTKLPSVPVIARLVLACDGEVSALDIFKHHFAAATGACPAGGAA